MSEIAVNALLKGLCLTVGIDKITLDEDLTCRLMFDAVPIQFGFEKDSENLRLDSFVGVIQEEYKEEIIADLLDANYVYKGTDGATFGIEEETDRLVLSRLEAMEGLSQYKFEGVLERFVNVSEFWMGVLSDYSGPLDLNRIGSSGSGGKKEPEQDNMGGIRV